MRLPSATKSMVPRMRGRLRSDRGTRRRLSGSRQVRCGRREEAAVHSCALIRVDGREDERDTAKAAVMCEQSDMSSAALEM